MSSTATGSEGGKQDDIAALAKGGRTNVFGFVLRLIANVPFLVIAGRFFGAETLGIFASARVVIEIVNQFAILGQRRGLAAQLAKGDRPENHVIADGLLLALLSGIVVAGLLLVFPAPMFPSGQYGEIDRLLPLTIIPFCLTEVALAACAYRYDIATTVRARAIVEPWALSIAAGVLLFIMPTSDGLSLAFMISIVLAMFAAFIPMLRSYGLPKGWSPHPVRIGKMALELAPLAIADAIEWSTRKIDIVILGFFASPAVVGVYYIAQQIATLPQKLKASFEPILGPVITRALKDKDYAAIARQVRQVGFWILAAQLGIALALGIPGEAVMGLLGPNFVGGTGALAFLLAAEVAAALAVVSESALVYVARMKNLWVSFATITFQVLLTIAVLITLSNMGWPEPFLGAAAAASLFVALAFASLIKGWLLSRLLGQSVNNWRWALVYATAPAVLVGFLATQLPEWAELIVGIPAILGVYGWIIWHRGFGPEDRVLFKKNAPQDEPASPSDSGANAS